MKCAILITLMGLVAGCSTASINQYSGQKPVLKLEEYFNGKLAAQGIFQDRSGLVVKRFSVAMIGTWKNEVGTLEEDFIYSDGTTSRRVWTIRKTGEGHYIGTAADVVGEAIGEASGNAFRWRYTMDLPVGKKTYHVKFDDWMYLMDDKIMLNKSTMSKFGVHLGDVTLSFQKPGH